MALWGARLLHVRVDIVDNLLLTNRVSAFSFSINIIASYFLVVVFLHLTAFSSQTVLYHMFVLRLNPILLVEYQRCHVETQVKQYQVMQCPRESCVVCGR